MQAVTDSQGGLGNIARAILLWLDSQRNLHSIQLNVIVAHNFAYLLDSGPSPMAIFDVGIPLVDEPARNRCTCSSCFGHRTRSMRHPELLGDYEFLSIDSA